MKHPEEAFKVTITSEDELFVVRPDGVENRVAMREVQAIYVETNDTGPWGADVWWLVEARNGVSVAFPQMATGELEALDRFARLPGFEVKGMNSVANERFLCWTSKDD